MIDADYTPQTPQNKPTFTQPLTQPSSYDFPDIRKSKFFKLKDFQSMNDKFNQDLQRASMYRNLDQQDSHMVDEGEEERNVSGVSHKGRLSSFDFSRLEDKQKKTGFMFDCFNVFKKQRMHNQSEIYDSRIIDESKHVPNESFKSYKSNYFFDISNSSVQNLSQSKIAPNQNNQPINVQNQPINLQPQHAHLSPHQIHQTYQIKLDFKLNMRKPQFCMGAFSHTQTNVFGSGVNLNISLPSLEEHKPFSAMFKPTKNSLFGLGNSRNMSYGDMDVDENIFNKIKQSQSHFFQGLEQSLQQSTQSKHPKHSQQSQQSQPKDSKSKPKSKPHQPLDPYALSFVGTEDQTPKAQQQLNTQRALEFGLIQMDAEEISFIAHKQQQPQHNDIQNILNQSIFDNYEDLLKQSQYLHLPVWESRVANYQPYHLSINQQPQANSILPINSFQISYEWHQEHMARFEAQFSVKDDALFMIDDQRLFVLVAKMLQGIENQLFMLDYERYEWYIDIRGLRFEHTLRSSFVNFMQDALSIANMRSRLEKALEYMTLRPLRKVYYEVAKVIKNVFKVFEEYLLEFVNQSANLRYEILPQAKVPEMEQEKQGFVEFFMNVQELVPEIRVLYQLLICEQEIEGEKWSYFTFDHRFLNSEFYVFEKILKMSRQVDQTNSPTSQLAKSLLRSAFKPIISSLNRILFQQMTSISSKQQIYLKYYYESTRQLFNQVSKKMQIIHKESPQLYVICKQKLEMNIEFSIDNLRNYDEQWSKLFLYKYTQLQQVLNKMITKNHEQKHVTQKKKEIQLQLLKKKLKDKTQKQIELKLVEQSKRDEQLTMLRKQIKQKQQRKRLEDLIEKQAERGYLLEDQLKKKIGLLKQKEKLINQLEGNAAGQRPNDRAETQRMKTEEQRLSMKELMQDPKPLKWKKPQQVAQSNSKMQIQQPLPKQPKNNQSLPIFSQQAIILPIVNQEPNNHHANKNEIQNDGLNEQQPKSPKSTRSRKIRKQAGKIKSVNKRAIPGRIYFNKKIALIENAAQNSIQPINFAELCQKHKKLTFHIDQQTLINQTNIEAQQSDSSFSSQSSSQLSSQIHYDHLPTTKQSFIPTNCIFEICIDKVLNHQTAVVNNCFQILVFQKYHFKEIIKFMKNIFFSQNGSNLRTLLSLSVNSKTSAMSLKCFNQCFLFDSLPDFLNQLKPSFYNTRQQSLQQIQHRLMYYSSGSAEFYGEFNLIRQDLQQFIGFQFANLPTILEPYFSYIHLSKYMQIFSFILRIKHCEILVGDSWLLLNEFKKLLFKKQKEHKQLYGGYFQDKFAFETRLLNQVFVTRHIIQSFLTTYQNYIFFRVIQKQFKSMDKKINKNQLNELQNGHLKLLDTIIRFAFVDNSVNNITKQIRKLLEYIREFKNIVDLICHDDILEDQKHEVRSKVQFIHTSFKQNQKFFQALYFKT